MYPVKTRMHKILVLRPGALGDVLAVRGTLRFLRSAFPDAELCLIAPGERGALFQRAGWVDHWYDWDRSAFSWLFSEEGADVPPVLSAVFAGCDWILSYAGVDNDEHRQHHFESRIDALAPNAAKLYCPALPPKEHAHPIGEWLAHAAVGFCRQFELIDAETPIDLPALAASRLAFSPADDKAGFGRYAVFHPGSGSPGKNWPVDNFARLGELVRAGTGLSLVVTSGEADGDAGERLAECLGARHIYQPSLESLARILLGARLYVGNDSGVSHLAVSVKEQESDHAPQVAVIFGPSDPAIWAPPGALVLQAGPRMDGLTPSQAWEKLQPLAETALE